MFAHQNTEPSTKTHEILTLRLPCLLGQASSEVLKPAHKLVPEVSVGKVHHRTTPSDCRDPVFVAKVQRLG
jgi:hypothetical protein